MGPHEEWRRQVRRAILREICPAKSCQAPKGKPCINRSGHPVSYFHVGRQDKAYRKMGIAMPVMGGDSQGGTS